MMLVSDKLIVTHVSTHLSLREAIDRVKKDRILDVIRLTHNATAKLRPQARIALAGLNPHAGGKRRFRQGGNRRNRTSSAGGEGKTVLMFSVLFRLILCSTRQ